MAGKRARTMRKGFKPTASCSRTFAAALLFIIAFLSGCGGPRGYFLIFGSKESGEVLRRVPVDVGDSFFLDYTHSSEKTPIHDTFVISEDGTIVLTEERFDWYAVGLEFRSREGEAVISLGGSETRVALHRVFSVLPIRIGWVANQSITIGGQRMTLTELAESGELLEIWTERRRGGGTYERQAD